MFAILTATLIASMPLSSEQPFFHGNLPTTIFSMLKGGVPESLVCAGTLEGSRGEPITTTRPTPRTCACSTSTLVSLPAHTPCVEPAGLNVWGDHTNLISRPKELVTGTAAQAPWTSMGTTLAQDYDIGPAGAQTADRVRMAGDPGGNFIQQLYGVLPSNNTYTGSFYVRSTNGTNQTFRIKMTHAGVADYFSLNLIATASWQRFAFTQTYDSTPGSGLWFGLVTGTGGAAIDILVDEAMLNIGPVAAPPCTSGSSAPIICNGDMVDTSTAKLSTSSGAIFLDWIPRESRTGVIIDTRAFPGGTNGVSLEWSGAGLTAVSLNNAGNTAVSCDAPAPTVNKLYRIGVRWVDGRIYCSLDGTENSAIAAQPILSHGALHICHRRDHFTGSTIPAHCFNLCFNNTGRECR